MQKVVVALADGLYYGEELVSNCLVKIVKLYSLPNSDDPTFADVEVKIVGREPKILQSPLGEFSFDYIKRRFPMARCSSPRAFESYLVEVFNDALSNQSVPIGTYFDSSGIHSTASGRTCSVVGSQLVGIGSDNVAIAPEVAALTSFCNVERPLSTLFSLARKLSAMVIFAIVFGFASTIMSVLRREADFQGVLFLYGPSAVGKTTLARVICGWLLDAFLGMALLLDGGTSLPAIRDAMAFFRDFPLMFDDGCIPGRTRRKRLETTATVVREASNLAPMKKKAPGGETIELACAASVIVTGEYPLDEISLLNRSVLAPIKDFLNLPPDFTTELVGSAMLAFVGHFVNDADRHVASLRQFLADEADDEFAISPDDRVTKNLRILQWVCRLAIEAARAEGATPADLINTERAFGRGLLASLEDSAKRIGAIRRKTRTATIPQLIGEGYKKGTFSLAKKDKPEKLWERDGILFHGDLCLRGDALLAHIMRQAGYQNVNKGEISDVLFRIGALVIQEDGNRTVHIGQYLPRVYRIKLDKLKAAANADEG